MGRGENCENRELKGIMNQINKRGFGGNIKVKQKRILIISTYFPPQPSIASLRAYSFAKYWTRMGNDVTILTTKKIDNGELNLDLPIDKFDVIEIPYFNIVYETGKILRRLLRSKNADRKRKNRTIGYPEESRNASASFLKARAALLRFPKKYGFFTTARIPDVHDVWINAAVKSAAELLKSKKIDWIYSSYGPPASHIVAGILSKKHGCSWVADYRDLWIEGHIYPGMWPFTVLEKYLEKKYVGNHADIITTVSEPLANTLKNKFRAPVYVIENGYDEDDYYQDFPPYFRDMKKRIVYTGSIYPEKRDPSPLFAAIASMTQSDKPMRQKMLNEFEVLFFGSESDWLNSLIKKYRVQQWVKYMGRVNRVNALRIQKQADILLFLEWENGSVDGILTGKLFEYLAMKKPILGVGVSAKTSPGALIEQAGVGLAVGKDVEKITSILRELINTGKPFDIQPKEDVIGRYTRKKQAERLLEIMDGREALNLST